MTSLALGLVPRDGAVVLGRREFGTAAMAEHSTLNVVKPSSPACAAGLGTPLAMAECKRKRASFYANRLIDLSQGDPVEQTYNTCGVNAGPPDTGSAYLLIKIRSLHPRLPNLTCIWLMRLVSCSSRSDRT